MMANPLSVFRKYQAFFLVVFGVVLMVAFIVAPPLDDFLRSQSQNTPQGNPVVVQSMYGTLRERDLDSMRQSHARAMYFLNQLVQETYHREGTPRGQGFFTSDADSDLVHNYLLAKKAESMGLVVSDQAIVEFLEQLSDGIPPAEIGVILEQALGDGTPESYVLDQLRVELLAMRMRAMSQAGLFIPPREVVTPIHAWQYFKRLHHRVKAEIVPLEVAAIAEKLTDKPTAAELTELYEAGKDRFPDPDRPEPGFKHRRKAAFQFVKFEFNQFLEAEKGDLIGAITDEEIEQHYEQNKQRYEVRSTESELIVPAPSEGDAPSEGENESSAESTGPEKPEAPESAKPAAVDPQPPASKPADEPADKPDGGSPFERPPSPPENDGDAEKKDSEKKDSEKKEDADETSSNLAPSSAEFFISLDDDSSEPSAASAGGTDDKTDGAQTDGAQTDGAQTDGAEPKNDELNDRQPVKNKPAGESSPESSQPAPKSEVAGTSSTPQSQPGGTDAETNAEPSLASDPATEAKAESGVKDESEDKAGKSQQTAGEVTASEPIVEVKYRALDDELREEIRNEVATDRAQSLASDRQSAAMEQVRARVNKFSREYRVWTIESESDESSAAFTHLDVTNLELDELTTAGQTPDVDAISVQDFDEVLAATTRELGRSIRMPLTFSWPPQQFPFHQEAFVEGVPLYSVGQTGSESTVSFLYWRVKEEPQYVPEFAEARDEVEAAWRKDKALKEAKDSAEDLVDRVRSSGETLADFFTENEDITKQEIIQTNEFSWMSTGFTAASFGAPALSHVDGVDKIGPKFMESVFSLQPGGVGFAINQPETFVYLVRIISESTEDELKAASELLHQRFLQSGISSEVGYIAEVENFELRRKWHEDFEKEMSVEWQRPPVDDQSG